MMRKKNKQVENDIANDSFDEDFEPDFSDPEDFVDDVTDEELVGDLLAQKPKESDVSQSVVIIDGLPEVGTDRIDKLKGLMKKIFKDYGGGIVNELYPMNSSQKTKGFAVIEMKDKASAEEALRARNNYALDKHHTLSCYLLSDVNKYDNVPEKFTPPAIQPYQDMGNLHYYLLDPNCFDQFAVIHSGRREDSGPRGAGHSSKTSIFLNSMPEPSLLEERPCWTETMVRWSPCGTYLSTFHQKGIALWGREKFEQVQKFQHPGVQFIDYSPKERYLVTFSPSADQRGEEPKSIFIWDTRTGQKKRAFNAEQRTMMWPIFKWSHDDKFFARLGQDMVSVYETPSFGLLDKKSVKISGIKEFSWSPTDNTIAYWIAENKDVPAKVALMSIPGREDIRSKNLFNVADAKIHWQKSGDYLCVKVARYTKAKREKNEIKYSSIYYSLEIFHMRERGVPVDSIEIKENIICFEWEPVNNRFAIISGESPHINVSFYQVNKGQIPVELKRFEKKACNSIFWSPRGQFVVLAGLRELSGAIEFIDTNEFQVMNSSEHFMVTDIEWDPTGRYVASIVSWWGHKVDNAYWLWTFQGKCIRKQPMDQLCQFLWRPRHPSPITSQDMKEIKKKMKKYTEKFDLEDKMRSSKASQKIIERRQTLMKEFTEFRNAFKSKFAKEKSERVKLRERDTETGGKDEETMEEVVEFLIKKEKIPV